MELEKGLVGDFSHEMGFRWKMSASQNSGFSWEDMYHTTKMVFLITVGERGNKEKHRKEGKKFFPIPELEV